MSSKVMNEDDMLSLLDGVEVPTDSSVSFDLTAKKDYNALKRYYNVTSYSVLLSLHACPRMLQLDRYRAFKSPYDPFNEENLHFAFGHAVGAGVQAYYKTGDLNNALFNCYLAWSADFDSRLDKKSKSIWEAGIAVEKFVTAISQLDDWELVWIGDRAGIELSFSIDTNNGFKHYGHIDVLLKHKYSGEIAVLELKTTGLTKAEEALYANSSQALGYSIVIDTVFPGRTSYEVFHFVYSSSEREWTVLPFTKYVKDKAEWVKDTLLDHSTIDQYETINFYPKRGESCFNYNRRCDHFGLCNVVPAERLPKLDIAHEAERVDIAINLHDIIAVMKEKM